MSYSDTNNTSVTRQRHENNAKLLQYANTKRIQGEFNDVTIQAGGQSISANRMVLSCYSKFFESMFSSSLSERYQDTVVIEEFDGESIKILIEFIYTGTIDINIDNVTSLLSTADFLQIGKIKEFCFDFLERDLTVENCLDIWKISNLYNNPSTLKQTYQYICEHFLEIAQKKSFKTLSIIELKLLISSLDRNKVEEMSIYKAILNWVKHDDNRKSDFPDLFEKINFHKLSPGFVAKEVAKESLVKSDLSCSNTVMLYFASRVSRSEIRNDSGGSPNPNETKTNQSKIFRIGGVGSKSVEEVYNISGKPAVVYPDLPLEIYGHCSVKVNNFIFCIGGRMYGKLTNKVYKLNLNEPTLSWKEIASMIETRCSHGAAAYDGNIVVAGGHNGLSELKTVELYNVEANKWKTISSMKQHRMGHAVVAIGETFFAIGGKTNSVERLNGLDREWAKAQSMNCKRAGLVAVHCNGFIYAIGGDHEQGRRSVEKYDVANDQWMFVSSLNVGRCFHGACVLNDKIYVVGGSQSFSFLNPSKITECYNSSFDHWELIEGADNDCRMHSLIAL